MRPSLSEGDQKKLLEQIKSFLKDVKVTKEEPWGQKPLAYKIKRELAGIYHLMHLESETGIAKDFEKRLQTNDNILRFLLLRKK